MTRPATVRGFWIDTYTDGLPETVLERASDLRPLWMQAASWFRERQRLHFRRANWRPLSQAYARRKGNAMILRDSGALFRGLTTGPEVRTFNRAGATVGIRASGRSRLYYARFHQQGRGVPRRVVVPGLRRDEREAWAKKARDHIGVD